MAVTITEYVRPRSLKEALALLAQPHHKSVAVGGGVSVVLSGSPRPVRAIDLSHAGLEKIEVHENCLRVGTMATLNDLVRCPELQQAYSGVVPAALRTAATLPMRNLITAGGNIVQCYYWSTLPPLLLALDAKIALASEAGHRTVTADEFFTVHPVKFLQPGEIVTRIDIPLDAAGKGSRYRWGGDFQKYAKTANDYALVQCVAAVAVSGGKIARLRLVLSALGALPVRCSAAEQYISDTALGPESAAEAARIAVEEVAIRRDTRASNEYRKAMAAEYLTRAIAGAWEKANR
jgi:CO/xanthine dehydrogenase FAD-binding subunit